jgi:phosphonate transport system substrate-binding protein
VPSAPRYATLGDDLQDTVTGIIRTLKEERLMRNSFSRMIRAAAGVLGVLVALGAAGPEHAAAEIRLGTVPRLSAAEIQAMYAPLAEYLGSEIGEKVTVVVPKDFDSVKSDAKAGKMDIGLVNPLLYVQIKQTTDIEPLALSAEVKSGTRFRGIIIVRKDSGINKVQDLIGKKIVFVDNDSAAGYIFQMLLLSRAGLDVKKDFTVLPFAKKHDVVTSSVLNKTADAGGIREDELDKVKDKLDISQLRILGYSDYFPNWPIFVNPKVKKETADKIRAALLKLKPNDPKNEKILGPARLTGFIPVADKEYDDLRKAARLVGAL